MEFKASNLKIERTENFKTIPDISTVVFGTVMTDHMLVATWTKAKGWNSPTIKPYDRLSLQPTTIALHYCQTIFEGMKAYKNEGQTLIYRPLDHLRRFRKSARRMCLPEIDEHELFKCLEKLVEIDHYWIPTEKYGALYIRPHLFASTDTLGYKIAEEVTLLIMMCPCLPLHQNPFSEPISLFIEKGISRSSIGGTGCIKTGCNYGISLLGLQKAKHAGCDDILWLYDDEQLTELGTMNLFIVSKKNDETTLFTPALSDLILQGITRDSIIHIVKKWDGIHLKEEKLTLDWLMNGIKNKEICEIFGCGTACVVTPVKRLYFEGKFYELPYHPINSVTLRIDDELRKIQRNIIKSDWTHVIKTEC